MSDDSLLAAVLDSWDRNNDVLLGLLGAVPPGGMEVRAAPDGPSVAAIFAHIHYVRLVFVEEDAPEITVAVPAEEWAPVHDAPQLAAMLRESAATVRDAVMSRIAGGRAMNRHYDHPLLFLQHMIWHEGYHHGQVKLALKLAGRGIPDAVAGPVTWRVWMDKHAG